jgi:predicted nucleic acid-binding Zn ribbon protein
MCIGNFRTDASSAPRRHRVVDDKIGTSFNRTVRELRHSRTEIYCGTFSVEQAGIGLEKLVAQALRQGAAADVPVAAWPLVCGSAVAERSRALSFADGVLCVEVADAGWKSELQSLAPRYVAVINRYTSEAVRRIEFVVARS